VQHHSEAYALIIVPARR